MYAVYKSNFIHIRCLIEGQKIFEIEKRSIIC